jgi:hypothetical protein
MITGFDLNEEDKKMSHPLKRCFYIHMFLVMVIYCIIRLILQQAQNHGSKGSVQARLQKEFQLRK